MRLFLFIALFFCILIFPACNSQAETVSESLSPAQAKDYIGKIATICGKVVSARYATNTRRKPTFLNLDEPFPRQVFTALIWGSDRYKFGQPEVELMGERICVNGLIEGYKGKPEIIVREKSQLEITEED